MYRLYLRIRLWILVKVYVLQLRGWIRAGDSTKRLVEIFRVRDLLEEVTR